MIQMNEIETMIKEFEEYLKSKSWKFTRNKFGQNYVYDIEQQETIYIETTQDLIDEYSKQPLKFKSDKYLGEKDQKTMEELDALYKEYSEDDIDDVISSYGEFGASLKPLFNGKYTITFSKDKYKDTNIGVYDDLCKAWKSCFLFAITYNGNLEAFKKDDFYIENNIGEYRYGYGSITGKIFSTCRKKIKL